MIVHSANLLRRNSFAADPAKKDQEEVEDTLTWMVKEASTLMESMFVEEEPIPSPDQGGEVLEKRTPVRTDIYQGLEKAAVLQEARIFHDDIAVKHDPSACLIVICKLLRLMDTEGEVFTKAQATDLFFATTKLFVCQDEDLRRFVYLFLKEVHVLCDPNDVIIVTSSLMKDMTCDIDIYRANSLRVLSRIIDPVMLSAIERYVKQSIVDGNGAVASAGLLAGLRLGQASSDSAMIVRRWIAQVNQAIQKHNSMVQFHAILLLYQMKSSDRLGVSKIISQYSKRGALSNPMALIMIIRYTTKLMMDEVHDFPGVELQHLSSICREGYEFLNTCLTLNNEMVVFEAARALVLLPSTADELYLVVVILHGFLMSPKPCVKWGALKAIALIAERLPRIVARCNDELEKLTKDENPTVATIALTTLLSSCMEDMVISLLEKVAILLDSMENEYRISIVQSLLRLGVTFPKKKHLLLIFLGQFLMHKAAFEFKEAIVDGIVQSMMEFPETVESSLMILSQSLDTCEHVNLTTRILHLVAEMGPSVEDASTHIRYIYNCCLLGESQIRAAAVSSLAKFASHHRRLRSPILLLLRSCRQDSDDETRDRAAVAISILEHSLTVGDHQEEDELYKGSDMNAHIYSPLSLSFTQLERSLQIYGANPKDMMEASCLCFDALPAIPNHPSFSVASNTASSSTADRAKKVDPAAAIHAIPELAAFGRVTMSSLPVFLTEPEAEYVVHCVKHICMDHVILQFKVHNTVDQQRLQGVSVALGARDDVDIYEAIGELLIPSLSYGETSSCYVVLKRDTKAHLSACSFACELQFTACSVDEDGEEIEHSTEEEYALEDIEIIPSDFMCKFQIKDFRTSWDSIGKENEFFKKVGLQLNSLDEAIQTVTDFLGMDTCDGTSRVKLNATSHTLHLCGSFLGNVAVMARAQLTSHKDIYVLKIVMRSQDIEVAQTVLDWIS